MNYKLSKCTLLLFVLLLGSCTTPVQEQQEEIKDPYPQALVQANRHLRERNRAQILAFIDRTGWQMKETDTGLWYMIMEPGEGPEILNDQLVVYSYETRLLSGKFCYDADTITPKKIVIGKGSVEAGIEEGLKLLKEGSQARFILPPHLGHGNFGDRKEIPAAAILLVEVDVMRVRR